MKFGFVMQRRPAKRSRSIHPAKYPELDPREDEEEKFVTYRYG